jgi:hypothetical protein
MPHVFLTCFLQMMPSYFWKPPKNVVNKVLQYYERCTYKPVKVFDMFGTGCMPMNKEQVKAILTVENTAVDEKYQGLPTREGRMNKDKFSSTKEKLIKRFTNWIERNMSTDAKELLIKSVAHAIPAYIIGVFKLSTTLCDEMTANSILLVGRRGRAEESSYG